MTDRETFRFEVPEYTQGIVIKLLQNYVDIRGTVLDRMPKPSKPLYTSSAKYLFREKPFGASSEQEWPFMSKQRAPTYTDGKRRARMMEDLHVASLDLECALNQLTKEEFDLLADYYILGNGTIEELAHARGLASKGRLQERIQRIVRKVVRILNNGQY